MLKPDLITSGEFVSSLLVSLGPEASLDGMNDGGPGLGPMIDEEFLLNVVGMGLEEVFLTKFQNFMAQVSSCGSA